MHLLVVAGEAARHSALRHLSRSNTIPSLFPSSSLPLSSPFHALNSSATTSLPLLGNSTRVVLDDLNCTVACPSLQAQPDAWPLYILVSLYVLLFVLSVFFLCQSRQQGMGSFKNWFLLLQSTVAALRIIFFSVSLPWTFFTLNLFNIMLPDYLQFVTVSLLIVFLWKCILSLNNQKALITSVLYPVAGAVFAILGVVCAVYAYLADKYRFMSGGYDRMCAIYATFMYAIITTAMVLAAWRSYHLMEKLAISEDKKRKMHTTKAVFGLYFLVFLMRTAWCLTYAADVNKIQSYLNDLQKDKSMNPYYSSMVIFYFVFEIVPSVSLLLMLLSWLPIGRSHVLLESGEPGINTPLLVKP